MVDKKQLIICVESNEQAKIDATYINAILKEYYEISRNVLISYVYLDGKNNYNHKKIETKIKKFVTDYTKMNKDGKSITIYILDKDKHTSNPECSKFVKDVEQYCLATNREVVWFVEIIEHVMHGKIIRKQEKKNKVNNFIKGNQIKDIDIIKLSSRQANANKTSNVMIVFDKYLKRKNCVELLN